ncbi:folylpolyglutamate synthase [Verticillium alfalfae VaMs.102]|uniref:tetrahydrofolate synthase n=1 Tax=Verticillium alfalfae (strain VaMs.102 / ATCC MYA-4576 / FGSC 10136) TaxID=526221 RepID=C9SQL2_VERA1|nr:folylpolyglutamate synthase [Verticillium alfalfae VaMs.102]EEY21137.1 folylpolyglutamate synthase [Verticillium alfalfae VaMs.102]
MATPRPRDYASALAHLNLLIPNRSITARLAAQAPSGPDPNLLAIPEMLDSPRPHRPDARLPAAAPASCTSPAQKGKGSVKRQEQIPLGGAPLYETELLRATYFDVWDRFTASARARGEPDADGPASKPFYFRFLTVMAFHVFLGEACRSVVLEVGIGGAYDATNVVPAESVTAAVVMRLGVDHVGMLGGMREEIAWHKAGIMKKGRPAFTRLVEERPSVMAVLRERAVALECSELVEVKDADVEAWGGVESGLRGEFQRYNQALAALAAEEHLCALEGRTSARKLSDVRPSVLEALKSASLRGRHEKKSDAERGISWLLDGAHTTDSLEETAKWLAAERQKQPKAGIVLLFNQQEREASELLLHFLATLRKEIGDADDRLFKAAVLSRNDAKSDEGAPDADITVQESCREAFASVYPSVPTHITQNLTSAIEHIRGFSTPGDKTEQQTVLVTGSMHLVGGVIGLLEPEGLK